MTGPMGELGRMRLIVVDDQVVLRRGVVSLLSEFDDIEVVAEASSGEEALALCQTISVDVVLMDLLMPGMSGVEAIQALHDAYPDVHLIAFTSYRDDSLVEEALRAGAISYLLKDVLPDDLAKAIRLAGQGMPVLAPAATQSLVHALAQRYPKLGYDLTDRERQVLALLTEGLSNHDIAERLVITPATVKFHTRSIRHKLGTTSRTETAILALQNHLIPVG
jgi:NarL family two-component system response regulator LiaR